MQKNIKNNTNSKLDYTALFAEALRAHMHRHGLSCKRIADLLNVSPSAISNLKKEGKPLSYEKMMMLAELLGGVFQTVTQPKVYSDERLTDQFFLTSENLAQLARIVSKGFIDSKEDMELLNGLYARGLIATQTALRGQSKWLN